MTKCFFALCDNESESGSDFCSDECEEVYNYDLDESLALEEALREDKDE